MFVHAAGDFAGFTLAHGEVLRADTDSLVWFDASVSYSAAWAGGVRRAFLGGEGLFLSTFTGPGRVTLQTMGQRARARAGKDRETRVYPGFPTLFCGLSVFYVGDLMGKALWKLVENAARFPRRGGRVLCVHGAVCAGHA